MPHDVQGRELHVGDEVVVRCTVKHIQIGEEYCNVQLETVRAMYPSEHRSGITLNAKQVELVPDDRAVSVPPKD